MNSLTPTERTIMVTSRHISVPQNTPNVFAARAPPWTLLGSSQCSSAFLAELGGSGLTNFGLFNYFLFPLLYLPFYKLRFDNSFNKRIWWWWWWWWWDV